jgi:hypothetical protein
LGVGVLISLCLQGKCGVLGPSFEVEMLQFCWVGFGLVQRGCGANVSDFSV